MCLLLGSTGVGKTLLIKRLQKLTQRDQPADLGEPPVTLPTVGTNLTDLNLKKKRITVRELGGCMGPIWHSFYADCSSLIVRQADLTTIYMVLNTSVDSVTTVCAHSKEVSFYCA